jgi:hypothetical protein
MIHLKQNPTHSYGYTYPYRHATSNLSPYFLSYVTTIQAIYLKPSKICLHNTILL